MQPPGMASMGERMVVEKIEGGYYLGQGVESPGIILSASTKEELVRMFKQTLPSYQRAIKHYGITDQPKEIVTVDV